MKLTRSEAAKIQRYSAREQATIRTLLAHGCNWHGLLLSSGCAECGMVRFYREEVGREAESK